MSSLCHRNSLSVSVSQGDSSSDNHISYAHTKNITQTYISTLGIHMPYICHHMPYICQTYARHMEYLGVLVWGIPLQIYRTDQS